MPSLKSWIVGPTTWLLLALWAGACYQAPASGNAPEVAGGDLPWRESYPQALEEATADDLPILAYLYTDWCGFCRRLEQTTFTDEELIRQMKNEFVWLRLNAETDPDGSRLRQRFEVSGYPTVLILDSEGNEYDRVRGYLDARRFQETVVSLLSGPESLARLQERADLEPDSPEAAYDLGVRYLDRGALEQARTQFTRIVDLDPANRAGRTDAALFYLAVTLASLQENDEALKTIDRLEAEFPNSIFEANALVLRGKVHLFEGKVSESKRIFEDYLERFPDHSYSLQVEAILQQLSH